MTCAQSVERRHDLAAAEAFDGGAAARPTAPARAPGKPGPMQSLPPAAGSFVLCWIGIVTLHNAEMFTGGLQQGAASGDATPPSYYAILATILLAVLLPVVLLTGLKAVGRLQSPILQGIAFGGVAGIVLAQLAALF